MRQRDVESRVRDRSDGKMTPRGRVTETQIIREKQKAKKHKKEKQNASGVQENNM